MTKLDELEVVLDCIERLQPKIADHLANQVLALNLVPLPPDFKELKEVLQLIPCRS